MTMPRNADTAHRPTEAIHLWLGGRSRFEWNYHERDNYVRTRTWSASRDLAAAEVLLASAAAAGLDVTAARGRLAEGWRALLKAEVSDATGITPWQGEFNYGVTNTAAAQAAADGLFASLTAQLGWPHASVDLAAGTAERADELPQPDPLPEVDAPMTVTVDAPTRTTEVHWYDRASGAYELHVTFGPGADPTAQDVDSCQVTVSFPREVDALVYTPGLAEDLVVEHALSEFSFHPDDDYHSGAADVYLPAVNGLVGLGGGWWVIRDNRTVMIAPRIPVAEKVVQFRDETADPVAPPTWVFHLVNGSTADALAFATRANLQPVISK
ncbi:MAG: hypothetical protein HY906_22760 [Deltaproteobacteria bacterium]|nr:hypothetical protein [Deltaproteobacteria bacterium]